MGVAHLWVLLEVGSAAGSAAPAAVRRGSRRPLLPAGHVAARPVHAQRVAAQLEGLLVALLQCTATADPTIAEQAFPWCGREAQGALCEAEGQMCLSDAAHHYEIKYGGGVVWPRATSTTELGDAARLRRIGHRAAFRTGVNTGQRGIRRRHQAKQAASALRARPPPSGGP